MSQTAFDTDIRNAARAVRRWAIENNLLRLGGWSETSGVDPRAIGAMAMSDAGVEALEKQKVTAIGFNRNARKIYVYTHRPLTKKARDGLPTALADGQGFPIEYRQARSISINMEGADAVISQLPYHAQGDVYACGSSIGIGSVRMAGTLGCLVRRDDDRLYGLSNNHVTGGCNNTRIRMPITAPGVSDVSADGFPPFTIGYHHAVLTMRQGEPGTVDHFENTDAALFEIADPARVTSRQGSVYDTPVHVGNPEEDMVVEKVGRTTGHRMGIIESELTGPLPVNYRTTVHHNAEYSSHFTGTVYFEPTYLVRGRDGPFALPGDSGSLVTTVGRHGVRLAVGLVFAGVAPDTS